MEVETPILSSTAVTDPHLHNIGLNFQRRNFFLHTSPEFPMKRLLAAGSGPIYQICKVFRDDEQGPVHSPEFTMLEWYRPGFDHWRLMDEMEALLAAVFTDHLPWKTPHRTCYRQAFIDACSIDPLAAEVPDLRDCCRRLSLEIPVGMSAENRDEWLDWLLTQRVTPSFPKDRVTFLYEFPASQAALARLDAEHPEVACRFEVLWGELELANGFYELADSREQRRRFEKDNQIRQQAGLPSVSPDEHLLAALEAGLPDCAGVALGLDRLLMVLLGAANIDEVLAFSVDRV